MKNKIIYSTLISFTISMSWYHHPIVIPAKSYEAHELKTWWIKSEALLENPKVNLPAFVLEGRIGSDIYIYKLHKNEGNIEIFSRLLNLLEVSKAFELDSEDKNGSIKIKVYSGVTAFETVIAESDALDNNKLKLFFKILSENTKKRTISEVAQENVINKGS